MLLSLCLIFWAGLAIETAAVPVYSRGLSHPYRRADNSSVEPFSLPASDDDPSLRAQAIEIKRQTFLYGSSPTGGKPFFPAGPLGNATVYNQVVQDGAVLLAVGQKVVVDESKALTAVKQACSGWQIALMTIG